MRYTHLTQEERYQIYALRTQGFTGSEIAKQLKHSKATIRRELKRNVGVHCWKPLHAHKVAQERQKKCRNARRISDTHWAAVEAYIRLDCSPQQAIARLALEETPVAINHESVYQHIYRDKQRGGDLVKHLRCQKVYRKRYGSGQQRRGMIKNRLSIDLRPDIVDQKTRIGVSVQPYHLPFNDETEHRSDFPARSPYVIRFSFVRPLA
ncbi:MAG: IS30 family transposase [Glaciimonas sp.]|nr:IS30 family transposase [Glaciimonas sp.]